MEFKMTPVFVNPQIMSADDAAIMNEFYYSSQSHILISEAMLDCFKRWIDNVRSPILEPPEMPKGFFRVPNIKGSKHKKQPKVFMQLDDRNQAKKIAAQDFLFNQKLRKSKER